MLPRGPATSRQLDTSKLVMSLMAAMMIEGLALAANAGRLDEDLWNGMARSAVVLIGLQMFVLGLYSLAVLMAPKRWFEGEPAAERRLSTISKLCGTVLAVEGIALALLASAAVAEGGLWLLGLFIEMFLLGSGIVLLELLRGRSDLRTGANTLAFLGLAGAGLFSAGVSGDVTVSGAAVPSSSLMLGGTLFLILAMAAIAVMVLRDRPSLKREVRGVRTSDVLTMALASLLSLIGLMVCGFAGDVTVTGIGTIDEGAVMQIGLLTAVLGLTVPLMAYANGGPDRSSAKLAWMAAAFVVILVPFALIS